MEVLVDEAERVVGGEPQARPRRERGQRLPVLLLALVAQPDDDRSEGEEKASNIKSAAEEYEAGKMRILAHHPPATPARAKRPPAP